MYANVYQEKYCYDQKEYSYQEIENRLKSICTLNKANSWVYPDLTTEPVSRIAKIIRCVKSPLTWLANRFCLVRAATFPFTWLVNRVYKWNGIDIEKSKLFLSEIKRATRVSFDSPRAALADQAIHKFNSLFPKHQLNHKIQMPLLDTDNKEYSLNLYQNKLPEDAKYLGANQVVINENQKMSRTLYHLLFIYFALKNGNNKKTYPILKCSKGMDEECLSLLEIQEKENTQTINRYHPEMLNFFKERNLTLDQLTWKDVKALVDDLCKEFETIKETALSKKSARQNLFYHFYRFCFHGAKFKEVTLRALALEWESPSGTEILYRGAQISAEDVNEGENQAHSLSFSSSLFAGLVFEGTPGGTCSYVYYTNLANKQLYALRVLPSKLEKYFFYPILFKSYGLLPLIAKGEFSHPRLRVFTTEKTARINGSQGRIEQLKKLANFTPTEKINDPVSYRKKVIKMFQNNIVLLGA
jgi:hypothetical protein